MKKLLYIAALMLYVTQVNAHSYAVYMVPYDYNGPRSQYYHNWGGTKPHVTLAGFTLQPHNLNSILNSVAQQSRITGRWHLNCSTNHCNTTRSGGLYLLKFQAQTVKALVRALAARRVKDIKSANPAHTTLYMCNERNFNRSRAQSALERARNWRLVAVNYINGQYVWDKTSYAV